MIEVPFIIQFVLVCMLILSVFGVSCCIVDTVIKIREHKVWMEYWGENDEENSTLGTSEE